MTALTARFDTVASQAIVGSQRQRQVLSDLALADASLLALLDSVPGASRVRDGNASGAQRRFTALQGARTAIRRHASTTWEYLASKNPAILSRLDWEGEQLHESIASYGALLPRVAGTSAWHREMDRSFERYTALTRAVVALQQEQQAHITNIGYTRRALDILLDEVVQSPVEHRMDTLVLEAAKDRRIQIAITLAILLMALLLAAVAAERLAEDINEPLSELVRVSNKMSGGDLAQEVRIDSSREFNALGQAFNRMASSLHEGEAKLTMALARAREVSADKSRFVSDVSHEMRTPLTSLRGSLILLGNRAVDPASDRGAMLLQVAIGSTDRLIRMINDRLDLDKIEAARSGLRIGIVDLSRVVNDSFNEVGGLAATRGIGLEVEGESRPVLGDHDRLVQVLVNLLGNSITFSPTGRPVRVIVSNHGDNARVSVMDQGPGVAEADRERIFMRFEQADEGQSTRGTGLGLAIARGIVEDHRGAIGVAPREEGGATFWFTVPLADAS